MAEFGGFFNSINGDRKYKSEDFANYFKTFITTGVNPALENLIVLKKSNTQVEISPGSACVNGYLYLNSTSLTKNISIGTTRQDRVILKLDLINRSLSIYVKEGINMPPFNPPELQRDTAVYELSLAKISIGKSDFSVIDERPYSSVCGFMSFAGKTDAQEIWDRFNLEWGDLKLMWQNWFNHMQGQSIRGIFIENRTPSNSNMGDIWIQLLE